MSRKLYKVALGLDQYREIKCTTFVTALVSFTVLHKKILHWYIRKKWKILSLSGTLCLFGNFSVLE